MPSFDIYKLYVCEINKIYLWVFDEVFCIEIRRNCNIFIWTFCRTNMLTLFSIFCGPLVMFFNSVLIKSAISSHLFTIIKKLCSSFENIMSDVLNTWFLFHFMMEFVQSINELYFCNQNKFKITLYFKTFAVIISTFEINKKWQEFIKCIFNLCLPYVNILWSFNVLILLYFFHGFSSFRFSVFINIYDIKFVIILWLFSCHLDEYLQKWTNVDEISFFFF